MTGYGQFCAIARTLDLLGERWTLLVVREVLCGGTRFAQIRRGIPRISRTMLSARLRSLVDAGVLSRSPAAEYTLTPAGEDLASTIAALGTWGQRWLPRTLASDELDLDVLAWDMRRRVVELPVSPIVIRVEASDARGKAVRFLLLRRAEVSICSTDPGFADALRVRGPLRALTAWWRGDVSLTGARAMGMTIEGRREHVRAFTTWFGRYAFAHVAPAKRGAA
jgi:DNA-binding HxlR family transcriptional regulator